MSSYRESDEAQEGRREKDVPVPEEMDAELEIVLKDFRSSLHAWSEAEASRPRTTAAAVRRPRWRLAAGWALGCALVVGGVSGALYERNREANLAAIQHQREVEQQKQLAAEKARQAEEELAKVDKEVSRDVPAAMEPLAQLMSEDESQ